MSTPPTTQTPSTPEETWLSRFSAGLLESTWLVALVAVPSLCNPYAFSGLEPQKIILLELLASLALVAALIRFAETRSKSGVSSGFAGVSLLLTGFFCAVAVSVVISTAFSIIPSSSLWGSYDLRFNGFARLSLMFLGATVALHLKTSAQIERLISAAIAGAVPVAIYAIMQKAGADPLSQVLLEGRAASLIGQPIFLASYLWLILPVCLWRAVVPHIEVWVGRKRTAPQMASVVFHRLVALLFIAAFFCTESRGPLLGMVVGMVFFAVVGAVYWNQRRFLYLGIGAGILAGIFLVLISVPGSPLAPLQSLPILKRLATTGQGDSFRDQTWNEAWKMLTMDESIRFPSGAEDKLQALRPAFGFGPETLHHVLPLRFDGFGLHTLLEGRFHNLFWDIWFTTGWFGVGTFFVLILFLFYYSYVRLGFITSSRDRWIFWSVAMTGAAAGAVVLAVGFGPGYGALGMQGGLVCGLMFVPVFVRAGRAREDSVIPSPKAALLLALLAAIAGHLVETGFAWQISVSGTIFWVWTGLIAALVRTFPLSSSAGRAAPEKVAGKIQGGFPAGLAALPLTALLMVVIGFAFSRASSPLIAVIQLTSICACAFTLTVTAFTGDVPRRWLSSCVIVVASALALAGLSSAAFGALNVKESQIVRPGVSVQSVMQQGVGVEGLCLAFLALIFGLAILTGWILSRKTSCSLKWASPAGAWTAAVILPFTGWLVWSSILPPFRADVWAWWAGYMANVAPDASAESCRKAISLGPSHLLYRMILVRKLTTAAEFESNGSPDRFYREAESVLLEAQTFTKLDRTCSELGRLYLRWALHETNSVAKETLGLKAVSAFDQALEFEQKSATNWTERALVDLLLLGKKEEAEAKFNKANDYSRRELPSVWSEYYQSQSLGTRSPELKRQYQVRVIHYSGLTIRQSRLEGKSPYQSLVLKGTMHRNIGELDLALESYEEALKSPPPDGPWQANAMLAHCYLDKGMKSPALQHAAQALAEAPAEIQPALQQLRMEILGFRQP